VQLRDRETEKANTGRAAPSLPFRFGGFGKSFFGSSLSNMHDDTALGSYLQNLDAWLMRFFPMCGAWATAPHEGGESLSPFAVGLGDQAFSSAFQPLEPYNHKERKPHDTRRSGDEFTCHSQLPTPSVRIDRPQLDGTAAQSIYRGEREFLVFGHRHQKG
jgi:hypothetical protein